MTLDNIDEYALALFFDREVNQEEIDEFFLELGEDPKQYFCGFDGDVAYVKGNIPKLSEKLYKRVF